MPVVAPDGALLPPSRDLLKQHLNISDASLDEAMLWAEAASEVVQAIVGPVNPVEVTETVVASRSGVVLLSRSPVISVTSLLGASDPVEYTLDSEAGILSGVRYWAPMTVTYTTGRSNLPAAVLGATLIITEHLWQTQRGNTPTAGALPVDPTTGVPIGLGYAIPNRAMDLLRPYALPPSVA